MCLFFSTFFFTPSSYFFFRLFFFLRFFPYLLSYLNFFPSLFFRFSRLLEGDSSFGIDRTSAEFKETKAMKQIFNEQRNRREKDEKEYENGMKREKKSSGVNSIISRESSGGTEEKGGKEVKESSGSDDVNSLVNKLKRKYTENSINKSKQTRL